MKENVSGCFFLNTVYLCLFFTKNKTLSPVKLLIVRQR